MNPGIYYHILQIGVTYEKGRNSGGLWHFRERSRLRDECTFWRKLISYAGSEYENIDRSEMCLSDLRSICKKYNLPNYDRIIGKHDELVSSHDRFIIEINKRDIVVDKILELISEVELCTKRINGKADAYRAMTQMHNLPRVLHGVDLLGGHPPISLEEATKYSKT